MRGRGSLIFQITRSSSAFSEGLFVSFINKAWQFTCFLPVGGRPLFFLSQCSFHAPTPSSFSQFPAFHSGFPFSVRAQARVFLASFSSSPFCLARVFLFFPPIAPGRFLIFFCAAHLLSVFGFELNDCLFPLAEPSSRLLARVFFFP